jgi:hypothetical protein
MRSDVTDTERTLPRRDFGQSKCPSPFCANVTRVPGECCKSCWEQRERHKAAIRAFREKRQAAS